MTLPDHRKPYPDCNGDCGERGMYCCDGGWDTRAGAETERLRAMLRWAVEWIDFVHEIPLRDGDEVRDWRRFQLARELAGASRVADLETLTPVRVEYQAADGSTRTVGPAEEGRMSERPLKPGFLFRWYSICSAHYAHDEECALCNCGSWRFEPACIVGRVLFRVSPRLWQRWENR